VADRAGQEAAATQAILDEGARLASREIGDGAFASLQLVHEGERPLPTAVWLGVAGGLLTLLLSAAAGWLLHRRGVFT
jgi:hypothetical protein